MKNPIHENRINRILEEMKKRGLKQLLVSDPKSIGYLTDVWNEPYERMFALLLKADGGHKLFLNRLFNVPDTGIQEEWYSDSDDSVELVAQSVDPQSAIGIDKEWTARFLIPLMEKCPTMKIVLGSDCVDDVRACKDEEEKKLMRKASRINDETVEKAASFVKAGMTEKEVAAYINRTYREAGSNGPSFTTIVSFGANAADPHHEPDDTVLKKGDCVLIDMGCVWKRYCSDMTRTYFCGKADPEYASIHDLVRSANEKAESMIKPGVKLSSIDAAARDLITAAGYGENFNHRLGHFIGLTDHEKGDVGASSDLVAKEGMIFSIEPGVYLPGRFGVRVEDLILVTSTGCEVLNQADKHWKIVG
ncbi:MAG: Xaa-Pro peptidase family protein [Oscillospiraceae bacterium]|jgi:Xaa-Pro dipeptidase|nr:Xaa-Pro peptidase family protein [Oscillospiraceae bacterium]